MKISPIFYSFVIFSLCFSCNNSAPNNENSSAGENPPEVVSTDTLRYEQEKHIQNLRQLTFGGDNAEAYFSFDDKQLVFQASNPDWGIACDQIFTMDPQSGIMGAMPPMLSTGLGRTTCSFFMPGNETILYASTHLGGEECPDAPRSFQGKYVWPVFSSFDIFVADMEGNILQQLTDEPGYDAEATLSPDGSLIVFTSDRSGDLELYTMNVDGSNVQQVTDGLGYDGGAFFSPDGTELIFRASRPQTEEDIKVYQDLLAEGLVQPGAMELFICNVDGSNLRQITDLGGANWAPYFHPSGEKVLFASNHHTESGRQFNLFIINTDGTGLEQVTFDNTFDAFPMFSYSGDQLVFSSNRFNGGGRSTNVFIADWVD